MDDYKTRLSHHVEKIFKTYITPGLHICDIATGGGKSYTIGNLTCNYYPQHFDRIIILCVQKKLVDGMNREIDRSINSKNSLIKPSDKLVIENNSEVITKAIKENLFKDLLEEIELRIDEQSGYGNKNLKYLYNRIKKTHDGLSGLLTTLESNNNEYLINQINEGEASLRKLVRDFFETYRKHLQRTGQKKQIHPDYIIKSFPSLIKVYPQVEYKTKKVLLMTVHKAMYGIDPILSEKLRLSDFAENKRRTLILFDESDQAAVAMRNAIIDQATDNTTGTRRFAKGYNGYLQYKALIDSPEHISNEYYGELLEKCIDRAQSITQKNWSRYFGKTEPYKSIFLDAEENLEDYRRGVFFCGPAIKLNISEKKTNSHSYVCYRNGDREFRLVHCEDEESLKKKFAVVVPLDSFLTLVRNNTTAIKSQFRKVVMEMLDVSRQKFEKDNADVANNNLPINHYLGWPTLEREIHTLFSRFETTAEYQFEQQINEFITNRKNLIVREGNQTQKLPNFSVYSQGVQLYQEEIDERDNQHRVRLSCREITYTPEKIIEDLLSEDGTSVVLCSATSSCRSVVSNFDIEYLLQILGNKVHVLSKEDRHKFDELSSKTYPSEHRIEIVPIEHHQFTDGRKNHWKLPEKYKKMFSQSAQDEGLDEQWFRLTMRNLEKQNSDSNNTEFSLYRLFQFIETYYWFYTHPDVHSMIYFQNRTGDKDRSQFQYLSSLIDGTFKDMPPCEDDIPTNWENKYIRISKDWEEVEKDILSELSSDKESKLMLISAYGSFKAGTNLQYGIPEGLDFLAGDSWETDDEEKKKDWDALFLQSPTSYLMMNEDGNESTYEKSLYNAMLILMMLYERGCLSKSDVAQWLCKAMSGAFFFGEKNNPGIVKDKAAWAQTVVEQAVGRLCRTRNKPRVTYILFDETMKQFFIKENLEKSLTKEFKTLADFILGNPTTLDIASPEEIMRCNLANQAQTLLDQMRSKALYFTLPRKDYEETEEDDSRGVPHSIKVSQIMNQGYKHTIITKPVIDSLDDLDEQDKKLTFISKCYGDWKRDDSGGITYFYDGQKRACPNGKGKRYPYTISPSYVRLDVLMKNDVIRDYFEEHGYATTWKQEGLILHPQILSTDYAGEIGEEAFKALVLHYTGCTESSFKHLEGKDYELADFVVCNPDGSNRIAFDVKNMNPKVDHNDKVGDWSTTDKRKYKKERLGCEVIVVNMLLIEKDSFDDIHEIGGMIDNNGVVIPSAIERIRKYING